MIWPCILYAALRERLPAQDRWSQTVEGNARFLPGCSRMDAAAQQAGGAKESLGRANLSASWCGTATAAAPTLRARPIRPTPDRRERRSRRSCPPGSGGWKPAAAAAGAGHAAGVEVLRSLVTGKFAKVIPAWRQLPCLLTGEPGCRQGMPRRPLPGRRRL
jgi:hypothetical protein